MTIGMPKYTVLIRRHLDAQVLFASRMKNIPDGTCGFFAAALHIASESSNQHVPDRLKRRNQSCLAKRDPNLVHQHVSAFELYSAGGWGPSRRVLLETQKDPLVFCGRDKTLR